MTSPSFTSVEIRWFWPGALPLDLKKTLAGLEKIAQPPARTDHYLRFSRQGSTGVKLREGRLEVKSRIGYGRTFELAGKSLGPFSFWEKKGLEGSLLREGLSQLQTEDPDAWIPVRKERRLQYLDHRQQPFSPESEDFPTPFCQLEWSDLDVHDQAWWTFGVEAAPLSPAAEELAQNVARLFIQARMLAYLNQDTAYRGDYPAFLLEQA